MDWRLNRALFTLWNGAWVMTEDVDVKWGSIEFRLCRRLRS